MPIYEYRCQQCGTTLEVMQRMADAPLKHCDKCGADALEKLISQTSFILKGSGWYATDYKAKPSESGTSGSGGSKSESKSDKPGGDSGKSEAASSGSEAPKTETVAAKPSGE